MLDSLIIALFSSGVLEEKICEILTIAVRQEVFTRFPEGG